jgi:hypothetical protein
MFMVAAILFTRDRVGKQKSSSKGKLKAHAAEAELRYLQAGVSQSYVIHFDSPVTS